MFSFSSNLWVEQERSSPMAAILAGFVPTITCRNVNMAPRIMKSDKIIEPPIMQRVKSVLPAWCSFVVMLMEPIMARLGQNGMSWKNWMLYVWLGAKFFMVRSLLVLSTWKKYSSKIYWISEVTFCYRWKNRLRIIYWAWIIPHMNLDLKRIYDKNSFNCLFKLG